MEICTIGFTKHSAESFFGLLREEGVQQLIDVRLNNTSQLAGFAKATKDYFEFFLNELCGVEYLHEPHLLAPTDELLKAYRNKDLTWEEYEVNFLDLMAKRRIEDELSPDLFETRSVLLCSEHEPDQCHRRLIVEYLDHHWDDVTAIHLPRTCSGAT